MQPNSNGRPGKNLITLVVFLCFLAYFSLHLFKTSFSFGDNEVSLSIAGAGLACNPDCMKIARAILHNEIFDHLRTTSVSLLIGFVVGVYLLGSAPGPRRGFAIAMAICGPIVVISAFLGETQIMSRVLLIAMGIYFALFVGLRHEVGRDWVNYLAQFQNPNESWSEPGYAILNIVSRAMGLDIHFVNLVCGTIFVAGLLSFCQREPLRWLAVAVAVPYLIIVVGMGYTKQAASLGLLFWGLVRLQRGELKTYVVAIILATAIHATALICLLFAAITARGRATRTTSTRSPTTAWRSTTCSARRPRSTCRSA